ncbi:MAG: molybdenum cofactor biosynthesis protein B [Gammaproteobacteria bacterium]|nr:molybdenum cofactor biosynthesis protein B [Gammaproteobacteria bacterium]
MKKAKTERNFCPLHIALLTVTDRNTIETDDVGAWLAERVVEAGHQLADRTVVSHDLYRIRALVSGWIAEPVIQSVVINGGTGVMERNVTPEAIEPLLDKTLDGFGELFRLLSHRDIGSSAITSRAVAGIANATIIFAIPGSPGAARLGWNELILTQLDTRHRPCNLAELLPRMIEEPRRLMEGGGDVFE